MDSLIPTSELRRRRFSIGSKGDLKTLESRINSWLLNQSRWLRIERIEATLVSGAVSVVVFYDEPPEAIRGNTIPQTRCSIVVKDSEEGLQAVIDRVRDNGVFHLYEHLGMRSMNEPAVGVFLYHTRVELVCLGSTVRSIRSNFNAWVSSNAERSFPDGLSCVVKGSRVYLAVALSPYEQIAMEHQSGHSEKLIGTPIFGPAEIVKATLIDSTPPDPSVRSLKSEVIAVPALRMGSGTGDSVAFVLQSTGNPLDQADFDY